MQSVQLANDSGRGDFYAARSSAARKARETLEEPLIVAWKDERSGQFAPEIPGGTGERWHDYGESNAGMLEVDVGDDFRFIFTESSAFDAPDLNVQLLTDGRDDGVLCLRDTCTDEDLRRLGYFAGGGIGG